MGDSPTEDPQDEGRIYFSARKPGSPEDDPRAHAAVEIRDYPPTKAVCCCGAVFSGPDTMTELIEHMDRLNETANDPPPQRSRYHDNSTYASDPVPVEVEDRRLRWFCPDLYGWSGRKAQHKRLREIIVEHMSFGDSRAAVVVSDDPLLVAAYTDELDCVAILRFVPRPQIPELPVGSRLLTVNTYKGGTRSDGDLFPGPLRVERWTGFYPIIADFICANQDVVDRRKADIDEREWERTFRFGMEYLNAHPGVSRDGSPCKSATPKG